MGVLNSRPQRASSVASEVEDEPDYRFTLANERTYLAWIRTALGLLAGGVAVGQLASSLSDGAQCAISVVCFGLASVLAVGAYLHWRSVQLAIRRSLPLPDSVLVPVLTVGVGVIAALAVVATSVP
ncbi:YidH family protein [Rhodococcus wratislaviensis]|uniref:DUF202 domain-containing protein n=1 Tax=Rhodococcus wratislaviensis NBRC 100605 TaxID=1219028 RepID=X0PZ06_RHOWR|nr:DUF202 domain-containing protein [Rhodococcus wratislaviensis]GAF48788.1 hypothetical protein RW1_059_00520 [Rhodococcus wratislaviensis NBRC 100605]